MAELRLDQVGKTFAPSIRAVDEVTFTIGSGEYLALLGPSGCGKSTLLRLIAGLEWQSAGDIFIAGANVNALPPDRRDVALLFQRPAFILPQTVRQNLRPLWSASLSVRHLLAGAGRQDDDLRRVADLLGLAHDLERPVGQLSGGQQQRVALGRCLLRRAKITLLDEPLGHLDAPLRVDLRRQIRALAREFGLTVIHVTHDPAEAFALGDRVAIMKDGRILQMDEPRKLRRAPNHRAVAELIHHETGGINWLTGKIVKEEFQTYFDGAFGRWPISLQIVDRLRESLYEPENIASPQGKVDITIGIPVAEVQSTTGCGRDDADVRIHLKVQEVECAAAGSWVVGADARGRLIGQAADAECFERDQDVTMIFSLNRAYGFDAATGRTLFAPAG